MFGNAEFKLIVMCNLYSIFRCISILKSCKLKIYYSVNDKADIGTICHMFDQILTVKISSFLSIVLADRSY